MLSFFPRDVLDEIWDLVGSVSEGFPTYYCFTFRACSDCFLQRLPTFVLGRLLSSVKIALIENIGFLKALSI